MLSLPLNSHQNVNIQLQYHLSQTKKDKKKINDITGM